MKRFIFSIATIFVLTISFSLPVLGDRPNKEFYEAQKKDMEKEREMTKKHREHQREMRKHSAEMEREDRKHREEMKRESRKHREEMGREYRHNSDYGKHPGYRERPYDKKRHYNEYDHKGRRYDYHGHWVSWEQWDRYATNHPDIYKNGRYYHEDAHLMFRFCDPLTGGCFFFSIGR